MNSIVPHFHFKFLKFFPQCFFPQIAIGCDFCNSHRRWNNFVMLPFAKIRPVDVEQSSKNSLRQLQALADHYDIGSFHSGLMRLVEVDGKFFSDWKRVFQNRQPTFDLFLLFHHLPAPSLNFENNQLVYPFTDSDCYILHDRTPFKSHHAGAPSSTNCLQYSFNNRNDQTSYASFLCSLMQRDYSSPRTLYYKEKTFSIVLTCLLAENSPKIMATKFFRFFCCVISAQFCIKINQEFFDREKTTICFLGNV